MCSIAMLEKLPTMGADMAEVRGCQDMIWELVGAMVDGGADVDKWHSDTWVAVSIAEEDDEAVPGGEDWLPE